MASPTEGSTDVSLGAAQNENSSSSNGTSDKRRQQTYTIIRAHASSHIPMIKTLFQEYAAALGVDLGFQSFSEELATLPGKYHPDQGGEILLALSNLSAKPHHDDHHDHQNGVASVPSQDEIDTKNDQHDMQVKPRIELGCIALRSLSTSKDVLQQPNSQAGGAIPSSPIRKTAELKRLYISPQARGQGLGHNLTQAMMDIAREQGYHELKLDTLPSMKSAQKIYENLGFVDVEPYCYNPHEGVRFMSCTL